MAGGGGESGYGAESGILREGEEGGEGGFTSVLPRSRVVPPARPPGLCLRLGEGESGKRRTVFPLYEDKVGKSRSSFSPLARGIVHPPAYPL